LKVSAGRRRRLALWRWRTAMDGGADPDLKLRAAVERVYAAFAHCPLKPGFYERCSPYADRRDIARGLQIGPVRSLGAPDLAVYAFKARHTMGNADDFKYFLPRMLELYALDPEWRAHMASDTVLFEDARDLGWAEWPAVERRAVEGYLSTLWQVLIQSEPDVLSVDEFHRDVRALGIDFGRYLAQWRAPRSPAGARRLARFVIEYLSQPTAFHDVRTQIGDWLMATAVGDELATAYLRYEREPFASELATASDWLASWRGA
jgi:hypothetical protein